MYLPLSTAKKHLNLDETYHDDDNLLLTYIQAAEGVVSHHINRNLEELAEENNGELPSQVKIAVLMLVGSFYSSRESISYASVTANPVYNYILASVKRYASPHPNRHFHRHPFHPINLHHKH